MSAGRPAMLAGAIILSNLSSLALAHATSNEEALAALVRLGREQIGGSAEWTRTHGVPPRIAPASSFASEQISNIETSDSYPYENSVASAALNGQTRFTASVYRGRLARAIPLPHPEPQVFRQGTRRQSFEGATEFPVLEITAGYAYLRDLDRSVDVPLGWNASIARNLNSWIGLEGDVGGSYKSQDAGDLRLHAFLGGARFSLLRTGNVRPYVEVLAGVARSRTTTGGLSDAAAASWDPAYQVGGGIDFTLAQGIAIRAGLDWRNVFLRNDTFSQLRVVVGFVLSPPSARIESPPLLPPRQERPPRFGTAPAEPPRALPPATPPPPPPAAPLALTPLPPPPAAPPPPPEPPAPHPVTKVAPRPARIRATDLLNQRHPFEAAEAFLEDVRVNATDKFTVAIGVFCEVGNVFRQMARADDAPELFLLPSRIGERQCLVLLWGEYETMSQALTAMDTLPPAIVSNDRIVMPLSELAQ